MNKNEAIARLVPCIFQLNGVRVRLAERPVITAGSIAVKLALTQPNRTQIASAMAMARPLEATLSRLGAFSIRVSWHAGRILVEVPIHRANVHISELSAQPGGLPLGLSMDGRTVRFIFDDETPHLLVLGPTGAGKTTLVRAILYNLPNVPVAVLALKRKSWAGVQGATLLIDSGEIERFGVWLRNEMYSRAATGKDDPMFVVIDDVLNLLSLVKLPISEFISLGRETGIHLILTSQRAGESAGGATATGNITSRVVFGTASAGDASTMTGRAGTGAERLAKWRALLVTPDGETHFQAAYLGREEVVTVSPVIGWTHVSTHNVTSNNDNGYMVTPEVEVVTDPVTQIKELHDAGYSKNQIMHRVFGGKNDRYLTMVNEAITA